MVVIRLSRAGAKKRPFYHICVSDRRNKRDGRFIEKIGFFNPIAKSGEEKIKVDLERFEYWTSVGAQPSETVEMLIARSKLSDKEIEEIEKKKSELVQKRKQKAALEAKQKSEEVPAEEATAEEAPQEAAAEEVAKEAPQEAAAEEVAKEAPQEEPAEEATAEEAPQEEPAEEAPKEEHLESKDLDKKDT